MNVADLNPEWEDLRKLAELTKHLIGIIEQRDQTIIELRAEIQRLQQLAAY